MNGYAERLAAGLVSVEDEAARAFESRLPESTTLAFRVAFSVLRHQQDAEDVAQEALVKAHANLRQLRERDAFRAWLVRLTWRLAIDRRRGDIRRAVRETAHAREQPSVGDPQDIEAGQRSETLWRAIDDLPEKLRLVIVMASIEEQNVDEVARLLKLPAGTVKSRLFQARARLKEQLSCVLGTTKTT